MKIVCHVGLHKTATTYLQGQVFPAWRQPGFFYNPAPISGRIRSLFLLAEEREKHPELFAACKRQLVSELSTFQRQHPQATLLLSYEKFSQFDFCQNYAENASLLHELLPEAEVLLFLRYQPDWLFSLFRQAIGSGDYQDPFTLFGYREGRFASFERPWGEDGLLKIDALRADWGALIRGYTNLFGEDRLKVYFYEDFVASPDQVCQQIANSLGLERPALVKQERANVGFSIARCQELDVLARRLRACGLSWLIHSSQKEYRRLLQRLRYKDDRLAYLLHTRPKLLTRSLDWMPGLVSGSSGGERFKAQLETLGPLLDSHYRDLNSGLPELLPEVALPSVYLTGT
ncbi:MAG: hypothetical protein P8103_15145 [Candidatus Thiodiazotropha sp.]